jgi:hypothetical protein
MNFELLFVYVWKVFENKASDNNEATWASVKINAAYIDPETRQ